MSNSLQRDQRDLYLEGCLAQMDAGWEWFATRVFQLSLDQLRWRSGAGAWSILDCLSRLHHAFECYVPQIEQAIRSNPRQPGRSPSGILFPGSEHEFLTQAEPVIGAAPTAPPSLLGVRIVSPDHIVDQHPLLRCRYSMAVRAASELDLAGVVVEGSLHPSVRSLGGVIALLAAYDRRYIWHAERVRSAIGFPIRLSAAPASAAEGRA